MRLSKIVVLLSGMIFSVSTHAQILYEPVQYQFGSGAERFYYGGRNARLLEFASRYVAHESDNSSARSLKFHSSPMIFSDRFGYREVSHWTSSGKSEVTISDVRNEAYNNLPRYFSKRDLLAAAVPAEDGSYIIPAQLPVHSQIDIRVIRKFTQPASEAITPKGTILVIPKRLLEKKLEQKTVADVKD